MIMIFIIVNILYQGEEVVVLPAVLHPDLPHGDTLRPHRAGLRIHLLQKGDKDNPWNPYNLSLLTLIIVS